MDPRYGEYTVKVMMVHNSYLQPGGEDLSTRAEKTLLQNHGHTVELYEQHNERIAQLGRVRTAVRMLWSSETHQAMHERLASGSFDVMHVQNFFPLISPSAHHAAFEAGIPVVQSLRNYRLVCPNALFFRDGHVCEDCLGKSVAWPAVLHACYRDSRAGSAVVTGMLALHRRLETWTKTVAVYIALTHFARRKFVEAGFPADRISVKPNFIDPDPGVGAGSGGYAVFVGRLSAEKGIHTLLRAWRMLGDLIPLKVVGDGPLGSMVAQAASENPQVQWLGRKPHDEILRLIGQASLLVVPSECYETFGRVAIEAFARGTPVLASDIGALAEVVDDGRTGLHFRPGDAEDLAAKVEWLLAHPARLTEMRAEARAEFQRHYTAARNYELLMRIYQEAIQSTQ